MTGQSVMSGVARQAAKTVLNHLHVILAKMSVLRIFSEI